MISDCLELLERLHMKIRVCLLSGMVQSVDEGMRQEACGWSEDV